MPPPRKPLDERLDEIEAALPEQDPWERPTQARIRRITERTPTTDPPGSSVGKSWSPKGVVYACGGVAAAVAVVAGAVAPLLVKPDYTGWVKEERLKACETRLDERQKQSDGALDDMRRQVGRCYQILGDRRSQTGAQQTVIESMESKRRARP